MIQLADPSISQFLTRDPLDAQTGQAYEYAGDNPIDNSDPSGLQCSASYRAWANGNQALLKECSESQSGGALLFSKLWRPAAGLAGDVVTGGVCFATDGLGCYGAILLNTIFQSSLSATAPNESTSEHAAGVIFSVAGGTLGGLYGFAGATAGELPVAGTIGVKILPILPSTGYDTYNLINKTLNAPC
jgi:hypothetical protein